MSSELRDLDDRLDQARNWERAAVVLAVLALVAVGLVGTWWSVLLAGVGLSGVSIWLSTRRL